MTRLFESAAQGGSFWEGCTVLGASPGLGALWCTAQPKAAAGRFGVRGFVRVWRADVRCPRVPGRLLVCLSLMTWWGG